MCCFSKEVGAPQVRSTVGSLVVITHSVTGPACCNVQCPYAKQRCGAAANVAADSSLFIVADALCYLAGGGHAIMLYLERHKTSFSLVTINTGQGLGNHPRWNAHYRRTRYPNVKVKYKTALRYAASLHTGYHTQQRSTVQSVAATPAQVAALPYKHTVCSAEPCSLTQPRHSDQG